MRVSISNSLRFSLLILVFLFCVPLSAGAGEWELVYDNDEVGFSAAPSMTGNTVYLSDDDGNLIALGEGGAPPDLPGDIGFSPDGQGLVWKKGMGGAAKGAPVVGRDGLLFVLTDLCVLHAVNRKDGTGVWELPLGEGICASAPLVSQDNTVYVVSRAGVVIRAAGGRILTKTDLSNETEQGAKFVGAPSLGPTGTLYVGDDRGVLHAVRTGDAPRSYGTDSAIASQPVIIGDQTVLFSTVNGTLQAVSADDLELRWSLPGSGISGSPVVGADGRIYFATVDGIASVDANGTHLLTPGKMDSDTFNSSPLVTESGVWLVDRSGSVFRQAGDTTTQTTSPFGDGDELYTAPVVGDSGLMYVATLGGKVYRTTAAKPDTAAPWPIQGQYSERRSGDWPKIFLSSTSVGLSCDSDASFVTGDFSLTNGGPGILQWTAELVGAKGTITPAKGSIAPWNWVYPQVLIDEACSEEGDLSAGVLLTDQFGYSKTLFLSVLKNPVCISAPEIAVLSCAPDADYSFSLSACLGRGFSYDIQAPDWMKVSSEDGRLDPDGETVIRLFIASDAVIKCDSDQVIRIVAKEGQTTWSKVVQIRMDQALCCSPVTKLTTFEGIAIAGIGAFGDTLSVLGRDSNLLIEAGSGDTLFEMDRFGFKVNYTDLDWSDELIFEEGEVKQGSFSYGTPLFTDDDLYIPCSDKFLRRYSIPSNTKLKNETEIPEMEWEFDAEGLMYGSPAKGENGKIYVVTEDGVLSCIKNKNGNQEWEKELDELDSFDSNNGAVSPEFRTGISPDKGLISFQQGGTYHGAITARGPDQDEVVIVSTRARNILAFDAEEGNLLRYYPTAAPLGTAPVIHRDGAEDYLVFGTWNGYVNILSPDFTFQDRCDLGAPVSGKILIANDTIYAGNTDGTLSAVYIIKQAGDSGTTVKCRKKWELSLVSGAGGTETLWSIYPMKVDGPDLWVALTSLGENESARILRVNTANGTIGNIIHDFEEGERIVGGPVTAFARAFITTLDETGESGAVYQVDFPQDLPVAPIEYSVDPGNLICPEQDLTIWYRTKQGQGNLRYSARRSDVSTPDEWHDLTTADNGQWLKIFASTESLKALAVDGFIYDTWTISIANDENAVEFDIRIRGLCE